ncbi:MAG: hypothetical protein Fur0046_32730 [Cyanobacteria bacterium J069]
MIFRGRSPRKIIQNLQNSFQLRKSWHSRKPYGIKPSPQPLTPNPYFADGSAEAA